MTYFDDDSRTSGIPTEILETKEQHNYYEYLIDLYALESSDFNQYQLLKDNNINQDIIDSLQRYMQVKESKMDCSSTGK